MAYEDALSVPFMPIPPFPAAVHDTFDAGIPKPLGGVKDPASACTLIRRALPLMRLAFEKLIVTMPGAPLVVRVTSVTAKFTAIGTETLTVSWAPALTTDAADTTMASRVIRMAGDPAHEKRLTWVSPA